MKKKGLSIGLALMLVLLTAAATANICYYTAMEYYNSKLGDINAMASKYAKFEEVSGVVDKYFIGDFEQTDAMDMAMAGYVAGLGDQWSGYYNAEETARITEADANTYVGIGIEISNEPDNPYTVTKVEKNGPAEEAGIKAFDVLTHINGKHVDDFESSSDVVSTVRGEEGTTVNITVNRQGESLDFVITRAPIFNSLINAQLLDNGIGYLSIDKFGKNADNEFIAKLEELITQGAKGIIFDVRFNGGGYLTVMVNMLDRLLPECTIISTVDRSGKTVNYTSDSTYLDIPMAVLTNNYSISAAEFFAAALQEYGVADIVGESTKGKGYAQRMFPLSDGSSINLSVDRYYTPLGNSLAGVGIVPDYEVIMSEEDLYRFSTLKPEEDVQLMKAAEILAEKQPAAPEEETDAPDPSAAAD